MTVPGRLTQVGRVLWQLGVTHIPSYSPEACGRIERVFGTLQMRLAPELRWAEIATIAAANRYLAEDFVPDDDVRFAVPAAKAGTALIAYAGPPLDEVLCMGAPVGRDNWVRWKGLFSLIAPQPPRHHYVPARVRAHEYAKGPLAMFYGPASLGCLYIRSRWPLINIGRALNSAQRSSLWICVQRAALPTILQAHHQQAADK